MIEHSIKGQLACNTHSTATTYYKRLFAGCAMLTCDPVWPGRVPTLHSMLDDTISTD